MPHAGACQAACILPGHSLNAAFQSGNLVEEFEIRIYLSKV